MPLKCALFSKPFWRTTILLIYPLFLAYYPVVALRNHNIAYVDLATILRTLILVTAGTALIGAITYLIIRDLVKTGVITSAIVTFFLSYGHLYNLIHNNTGNPVRHRYLAGAFLFSLLLMTVWVLKSKRAAGLLSQFLAATSLVLLCFVLFESISYDFGVYRTIKLATRQQTHSIHQQGDNKLPDFYWIILDAHTRSDVLQERFGYDNSEFVQQLNDLGFFVASCSQSNYASTKLALISAMYGDYIQNIIETRSVLPPLETSPIIQILKSLGYQTITFENRTRGHFDLNEDMRLSRNQLTLGKFDLRGGITEFEKMMVDTSFLRFVVDTELIPGFNENTLVEWEFWEHYYQTDYILTELTKIPDLPGPKFIFTHIMVPHTPFIFTPDGAYRHVVDPINGYRSNVEFIDNRLPAILRTIIENSKPTPIIVIMGDHGPSTRRTITKEMRMATLNAYLVNETAKAQLYPTITPVNATRILLNAHFGSAYPLVDDISYYAYKTPQLAGAEIITSQCQVAP